jgi:hypothetical protein
VKIFSRCDELLNKHSDDPLVVKIVEAEDLVKIFLKKRTQAVRRDSTRNLNSEEIDSEPDIFILCYENIKHYILNRILIRTTRNSIS